jgi:hypothetical protein
LQLLSRLVSNDVLIHIWEVCRKRDRCHLGSYVVYYRSNITRNRVILLVTVVRISNLKYKIFWPCCWRWLFSCVCWSASSDDLN